MGGSTVAPPEFQAVGYKVTGITRRAEDHVELLGIDFEDAGGDERGFGMHIVVGSRYRLGAPCHAAA